MFDGDDAVGVVSTGGYAFATDTSYAFAWIDPAHATPGTRLEVLVLGDRRPARVLAAYDPKNELLRSATTGGSHRRPTSTRTGAATSAESGSTRPTGSGAP